MRTSRRSRGIWSHLLAIVCARLDGDALLRLARALLPLCRFVDRLGIAGHVGSVLVFGALVFALQLLMGWPPEWLPLAIIAPPYVVFRFAPALYQSSLEALSHRTDARAVGPLMDAVAFKLRRPRATTVRRSDRWIEGLVLRRLPIFLDRMPAGDAPALTREQSDTLRWLVDRPDYYRFFLQPGLHNKIEGVLDAGRRLPLEAYSATPNVY